MMNHDQNDCQQFSFITPLFPTVANTLKTKVGDIVGCIFDVECSVGGFLILKQIIVPFEKKKLTIICQKQNSRTNIGSIQIVAHLKRFCLTYHLLKSDKK
jgi:hypothetical protein